MKKRYLAIAVAVILMLVVAGCSRATRGPVQTPGLTVTRTGAATTSAPTTTATTTSTTPAAPGTNISPIANQTGRMVIRNGYLQLVVEDVAASVDRVAALAQEFNGYVVASQRWKEGERTLATISIRVPAESYDRAIGAIRALAMDVVSENTNTQDVTQEYVDLGSRLKNLEATEAQLLKIMDSTEKTEDVLSVQREITTVRGEIEQTKGRMQYLEQVSAMSYIELKLSEAQLAVTVSVDKTDVHPGEKVNFTGSVSGGFAPYHYVWDFGDGTGGNTRSVVHSYRLSGEYTVSLTVTDDKGYANTEARTDFMRVAGGWRAGTTASTAWNGLKAFGRVLADVLLWLAIFSPVWLIIGATVWLLRRRRSKKPA